MTGEDRNNKQKQKKNAKNTASNCSHFAFLSVKLLQLNGIPGSFGKLFFLM